MASSQGDRLGEDTVSVDKALARDRELRAHATARPWHQDGQGIRFRLVGPLPRSTVVVDPYMPNPQDAPLLLHRINTYEELEEEIERLRTTLRDVRARLDSTSVRSSDPKHDFESLARHLQAGITTALGDHRRVGTGIASAPKGRGPQRG
jgi:hypothetical protein